MNDFTKEELGEIFWILEGCTMDYIGKEDDVLINKIQSLIDSYDNGPHFVKKRANHDYGEGNWDE